MYYKCRNCGNSFGQRNIETSGIKHKSKRKKIIPKSHKRKKTANSGGTLRHRTWARLQTIALQCFSLYLFVYKNKI